MKKTYSEDNSQSLKLIAKEFITKIVNTIYNQYLNDSDGAPKANAACQDYYVDSYNGVSIEFEYSSEIDDDGFGISVFSDSIFIDECVDEEEDIWEERTDLYDTFVIKENIEEEMNKIAESKHQHTKKDKNIIKHMKNDII